jgi:hypothetical protein
MANRIFKEKVKHLEQGGIVKLLCKFTTGADGSDCTIVYGNGISAVNNTGEGVYAITLADKYKALIGCQAFVSDKAVVCNFTSETVASTKVVTLTTSSLAGSALDMDSKTAFVELTLRQ